MHANTLKFFGIVALAAVTLVAMILLVPTYEGRATLATDENVTLRYDKIKTNDDRKMFFSQFGWTVSEQASEEKEMTIPDEFDRVFTGYNEIQKEQGLDLSKYKNKKVTRYTYEITNYPDYEGKVYGNIIVYKNRVVGGDICSADPSGFVHGFAKPADNTSE
jgi:hypothetical protein